MNNRHKMLKGGFDRAASARLVTEHRARVDAHLAVSAAAVAALQSASALPSDCGPDIAPAPARGAFMVFRPVEIVPGSSGTARPAGYRGPGEAAFRSAIRAADIFDAMREAARRRHGKSGDDARRFDPPFTPGQEQVARDYRDLVERHAAGGMKCASLETVSGGGSGGEFIDAYVNEGLRLEALRARIGQGAALSVRRIRPSERGGKARGLILDRTLVDMVCLGQRSLSQVLSAHGWSTKRETREALRRALVAVLDRMQGYPSLLPQNVD